MAQLVAMFREASFFKAGEKDICIDSLTFRLYNKVTSAALVLLSVAVSARQFFGDPITCDAGKVYRSLHVIVLS